jgi:hypothetical protein
MGALDLVCHPDRLPRGLSVWPELIGDAIAVPVEASWLGNAVVCLTGADGLPLIDVEGGGRWVVPRAALWDVRRDGRTVCVKGTRVAGGERCFVCADLRVARNITERLAGAAKPTDLLLVPGRAPGRFVAWLRALAERF